MRADLFVSEQPVEHTFEIEGKTVPLFIREVADAVWRRYSAANRSDDLDTQAGARAYLISEAVCEADGKPSMTHEKACQLKLRAAKAIEKKILELESAKSGNEPKPGATSGSGAS